jgi:hypothetical protein
LCSAWEDGAVLTRADFQPEEQAWRRHRALRLRTRHIDADDAYGQYSIPVTADWWNWLA